MTLVVPFDGSELAEAALVRATEFGNVFDEDVLAASVIPKGNGEYARERGWIGPDNEFDLNAVISTLHKQVTELCPSADFRHIVVGRSAPSGTIAGRLRKMARNEDTSMVFIGSENAGHLVAAVGSVGGGCRNGRVLRCRHRSRSNSSQNCQTQERIAAQKTKVGVLSP